ncbi:MAG: tetratricopeptide repeat protein [Anaerolineales bacterium]|nr:tetratricopeptide repeat protein [Anaerolineales bacterium]
MTAGLEIRLLGGLTIVVDGVVATGFISNKVSALLGYLAVTRRPHQRDVGGQLLGEMPDADAKNNLRQALTSLRKVVDPFLDVTRDTVGLRMDAPWSTDVQAFLAALRRAGDREIEPLQQAAELYAGDFYEGVILRDAPDFEEWMLAQRARYRELMVHALHRLTELYMAQADFTEAIECATRLLAFDPWREETYVQLMLALAHTGQRSAALAQYRTCSGVLREVFGAEPAHETTVLYERIRAALQGPRHNLPAPATDFIGRKEEISAIRTRLAGPATRLITLVGVGGVGKTRLALEVAAASEAMFLNGVWWVSLAAINRNEPEALFPTLAEAIHCTLGPADPRKQVFAFLRQKELLLVLDNVEHLVEQLAWLSELLATAPGVKILATSRERLDLKAEQIIEVAGLPTDDVNESLHVSAAGELFIHRARRLLDTFELTPAKLGAIHRICRLVGGLPLGIELAAAWVRHMECAEIADAIAASLDFLVTSHRDATARQRSLRAVFEHSWHLLAATEQRTFAQLAVFRGSFTRDAAVKVAGANTMTLAALCDKSLVRQAAGERLDFHEVIRHYAAEVLAADPQHEAAALEKHATFYADFVARRAVRPDGKRQREALDAIGSEIDNIRGAWQWSCENDPLHRLAPFVDGLSEFYEIRSWALEGFERFHQGLEAVRSAHAPVAEQHFMLARFLPLIARFAHRLGRRREARELLEEALALPVADCAPADRALALNHLGLVTQVTGDYGDARVLFEQSRTLYASIGDQTGIARATNNLAIITYNAGDYGAAEPLLQESLTIRRTLEDAKGTADCLNNLGILYHELHRYVEEAVLLEEALGMYRQLGDGRGIATTLHNLGGVHLALEQYPQARGYLHEALSYRAISGDRDGEALSYNNLGTVGLRAGELDEARHNYVEALRVVRETNNAPIALDAIAGVADFLLQRGVAAEALPLLRYCRMNAQDADTFAEAQRLETLALARLTAAEVAACDTLIPGSLGECIQVALARLADL